MQLFTQVLLSLFMSKGWPILGFYVDYVILFCVIILLMLLLFAMIFVVVMHELIVVIFWC